MHYYRREAAVAAQIGMHPSAWGPHWGTAGELAQSQRALMAQQSPGHDSTQHLGSPGFSMFMHAC